MRVLLDTNILARIAQSGHPHHAPALAAVDTLRQRGDELFLVPQVLYEFWVICTRPIEQNGLGLQVPVVIEKHEQVKALFTLLPDGDGIFPAWEKLVRQLEVKGKHAHDARLVAAMETHRIDSALTFNAADFSRYPRLTIIDPLSIPPVPRK
jgi:predicted nucleic acid-binding protein